MMNEDTFQVSIVGKDTLPDRAYKTRVSQYEFLKARMQGLQKGQVIRLIIPQGKVYMSVVNFWFRICGKGKGHFRKQKQADDSHILWLWTD